MLESNLIYAEYRKGVVKCSTPLRSLHNRLEAPFSDAARRLRQKNGRSRPAALPPLRVTDNVLDQHLRWRTNLGARQIQFHAAHLLLVTPSQHHFKVSLSEATKSAGGEPLTCIISSATMLAPSPFVTLA